jgi:hypothetical protein
MTMSSVLDVNVNSTKFANCDYFEGTVRVDGLRPTKIEKRADGSTRFQTKSALITAAKCLANNLGYNNVKIVEKGVSVIKRAKSLNKNKK